MNEQYDALIVGGGLAGLTAALHLEEYNLKPLVIEKSDRVGGRVKTDEKDGFLLDRGFQVLLEQYPVARKYLNYEALDLLAFRAGALCFNGPKKFTVQDVRRNPLAAVPMLFSPVGGLRDKLKINRLVKELQAESLAELFEKPEMSTLENLQKRGFSKKLIARFFQPFFGGIFLEKELNTSSRMFEFVFKLFSEGYTSIPGKGMEEIPKQLKAGLKHTKFIFHTEVKTVESGKVHLANGETLENEQIIISTPGLLAQEEAPMEWQSTANYYFKAPHSPLSRNVIALNYAKDGLVNNFTVLSDTAKGYAPKGEHLVSVSLLTLPGEPVEEVSRQIKNELALSFGTAVQEWTYLHSYHVKKALPVLQNLQYEMPFTETRVGDGLYLAGDYLLNGSINAAMLSGESAAKALILNYQNNKS